MRGKHEEWYNNLMIVTLNGQKLCLRTYVPIPVSTIGTQRYRNVKESYVSPSPFYCHYSKVSKLNFDRLTCKFQRRQCIACNNSWKCHILSSSSSSYYYYYYYFWFDAFFLFMSWKCHTCSMRSILWDTLNPKFQNKLIK